MLFIPAILNLRVTNMFTANIDAKCEIPMAELVRSDHLSVKISLYGKFDITNTKFTAVICNYRGKNMLKVEIYVINKIMMSEFVKNGNLFVKKRPKIKTLNFLVN